MNGLQVPARAIGDDIAELPFWSPNPAQVGARNEGMPLCMPLPGMHYKRPATSHFAPSLLVSSSSHSTDLIHTRLHHSPLHSHSHTPPSRCGVGSRLFVFTLEPRTKVAEQPNLATEGRWTPPCTSEDQNSPSSTLSVLTSLFPLFPSVLCPLLRTFCTLASP